MKKKIYDDITETIGNTPLVRLNRTAAAYAAQADSHKLQGSVAL
jgi:hypothetical protein